MQAVPRHGKGGPRRRWTKTTRRSAETTRSSEMHFSRPRRFSRRRRRFSPPAAQARPAPDSGAFRAYRRGTRLGRARNAPYRTVRYGSTSSWTKWRWPVFSMWPVFSSGAGSGWRATATGVGHRRGRPSPKKVPEIPRRWNPAVGHRTGKVPRPCQGNQGPPAVPLTGWEPVRGTAAGFSFPWHGRGVPPARAAPTRAGRRPAWVGAAVGRAR